MASLGRLMQSAAPGLAGAAENFSRGMANAALIKRQQNADDQNQQLREREMGLRERQVKMAEDEAGRKTVDLNGYRVTFGQDVTPQSFQDWAGTFNEKDPAGWVQQGVNSGVIHSITALPKPAYGETEEGVKLKLLNDRYIKQQELGTQVSLGRLKAQVDVDNNVRSNSTSRANNRDSNATTIKAAQIRDGGSDDFLKVSKRLGINPINTDITDGQVASVRQFYAKNGYNVTIKRQTIDDGFGAPKTVNRITDWQPAQQTSTASVASKPPAHLQEAANYFGTKKLKPNNYTYKGRTYNWDGNFAREKKTAPAQQFKTMTYNPKTGRIE